ncbi:MAG: GAF domain-containing protein, partial [Anaerolineae bacterium]|nr:GAF domain-containing protein [Anaerolineae bacterium]
MATEARSIVDTADLLKMQRGRVSSALLTQIGLIIATAALLLATVILIFSAVLAIRWYNQPFLGVLINHAGVINPVNSFSSEAWAGFRNDLKVDDQIVSLSYDDPAGKMEVSFEGVANRGELLNQTLAERRHAQEITVTVYRAGVFRTPIQGCMNYTAEGATCSYTYRLTEMPLSDFLAQFGVGFAVAAICVGIGIFMWLTRRRLMIGQLTVALCAMGAIALVGRFDALTTFQLDIFWLLAACVIGGLLIEIGLEFPYPLLSIQRRPWLRLTLLMIPVVLFSAGLAIYAINGRVLWYDGVQSAGAVAAFVGALLMAVFMLVRYRRTVSPILREKAALLLIGLALVVAPAALWFVLSAAERLLGWAGASFSTVLLLPLMLAVPITLVYAQTSNPISSDRIISEGLIYTILGAALVIGFLLVTSALYIITAGIIRTDNPVVIAITLFVIAALFTPVRVRLERAIDTAFFRQRRQYDQRLEVFSRALTSTIDVDEVTRTVYREIDESLAPQYIHIFLRNYPSNDYEALPDPRTNKPSTNVRFRPESDMVMLFNGDTSVLRLDIGETPPIKVAAERARLAILNTPIILRLRSARRLNGFIALGARQSKQDYSFEETRYLESLATQAAAAYERAQIILEAQRNERELKVLSQASAALNIVMDFDTLLEFVYTQVNKVIPTDNFYIAFRDIQKDELYFAFYQEAGERLDAMEGVHWALERDLFSEVVRTQQPFKTDNFLAETQRRDPRLRIDNAALRAWMGVPLNAGEGLNLGCMAVATTDAAISYSSDQMRIFWDIASLAATALYKTRLY